MFLRWKKMMSQIHNFKSRCVCHSNNLEWRSSTNGESMLVACIMAPVHTYLRSNHVQSLSVQYPALKGQPTIKSDSNMYYSMCLRKAIFWFSEKNKFILFYYSVYSFQVSLALSCGNLFYWIKYSCISNECYPKMVENSWNMLFS